MSPELEDVLRKIVQTLKDEQNYCVSPIGRGAIQALINAIARTIMDLREPKGE